MLQIIFFPIFESVKQQATIPKQLISGFLLLVFLLITSVKLLHSHHTLSLSLPGIGTEHVEKSSDCPVCDYHLAKDTDHFHAFPDQLHVDILRYSYSFYPTPFVTSIGTTSSGRGPPSLV